MDNKIKEEPKIEENVILTKTEFEDLMDRLKRVEFAADKSHLAHFDEKNKQDVGKTVKLRMLNGKVIVSWSDMLTNTVEKTPNGGWYEDQKVEIQYEDKTTETMDLVVFNRRFTYIRADVLSESNINNGEKIILKLKTVDGREYEIDNRFIN